MSLVSESKSLLRELFSPNCSDILLCYIIDENELNLRRLNYMKSVYETILLDMEQNIKFFIDHSIKDISDKMIHVVQLLFPPELTLTRWSITKPEAGCRVVEAQVNSKISYFYWFLDRVIDIIVKLLPVECEYLIEHKSNSQSDYVKFLKILFKVKGENNNYETVSGQTETPKPITFRRIQV